MVCKLDHLRSVQVLLPMQVDTTLLRLSQVITMIMTMKVPVLAQVSDISYLQVALQHGHHAVIGGGRLLQRQGGQPGCDGRHTGSVHWWLGAARCHEGLSRAPFVVLPLPVFYLRVGWENLWGNPIFGSKKHIVRICFASNQSIEIYPIYLSICQSIDRSWSIYLTIDLPACNINPKGWKSINGTPM